MTPVEHSPADASSSLPRGRRPSIAPAKRVTTIVGAGRFYAIRGIVLVILAALVIWLNFSFIKPLIMGAIFATVLYPLMRKTEKWIPSKTLRAALVTVFFTIAFLMPLGLAIYLSADTLIRTVHKIPGLETKLEAKLGGKQVTETTVTPATTSPQAAAVGSAAPLPQAGEKPPIASPPANSQTTTVTAEPPIPAARLRPQAVNSSAAKASSPSSQFSPKAILSMLGMDSWIQKASRFFPVSQDEIMKAINRLTSAVGLFVAGFAQDILGSLPGIFVSNFIILITLFFLLKDGPKAVQFFRNNSIFGLRETDHLIHAVASLCYGSLVATLITSLIQGGMVAVAALITNVPNTPLIFMVAFFFSFFPLFGTLPVTVTLALVKFFHGDIFGGVTFLITIGAIVIADNLVRPYVLKGGTELHPLIAFIAAFGALDVIGFYGLFIGPVVAGLFFVLLPMVAQSYGQKRKT